jgi:Anti-sigma-K factor rskA
VSHTDPAILALRALGEQAGSAQDDAHEAQCADCQRELERLSRVVGIARSDGPAVLEQPPPAVWARIAAAVGADPLSPAADAAGPDADVASAGAAGLGATAAAGNGSGPVHADAGGSAQDGRPRPDGERPARARPGQRLRRGRIRLAVAVAGAAAGLVIGIGGTVAVTQLTQSPASTLVADIALRPLPQFPQWQGAAGTAVLRETPAAQQLAVSVTAPRRTGFYEVWLLGRDGTSMISLGDLNTANNGTFTLPAGVDLRFYSRIDVSLQPFNGSTQHSSTSVVRGSLPSSGG